jgi:hypothetical protein
LTLALPLEERLDSLEEQTAFFAEASGVRPQALLGALIRHDVRFVMGGYDDLVRRALDVEIGGLKAKVVHLEDSIRIKRTIGGAKYLSQLPLLRDLQAERRRQGLD